MNQADRNHARQMAAFDHNSQNFRALNQLMWQIPLISMTLTGGLWFGVAKAETSPILQIFLLGLAAVGNAVLWVVIHRLRYVMERYLLWLRDFNTSGFVVADGDSVLTKPLVIREAFQIMFLLTALISVGLMVPTAREAKWFRSANERTNDFYDRSAEDLANRYETVDFAKAHPELASLLATGPKRTVLDVGAGTGRDAAAMVALGHAVSAVEPSDRMRAVARASHPGTDIEWIDASLPRMEGIALNGRKFDVILLSAVWMHIPPSQRQAALERLVQLLAPGGQIHLTLRLGSPDRERVIYAVSPEELAVLAQSVGLAYRSLSEVPDLLGRTEVRWKSVVLTKAPIPTRPMASAH